MSQIINFLSSILGYLMDFFFQGLTFIGYPRLWACIVLFAVVTRFLFLPQKISSYRSKLLGPVVKREILEQDPNFYEKTNDRDLTIKRAALKKATYKKYKLSNSSGCLTSLIQYPILIALFSVVKHPQKFIPSLETLSSTSSQVTTFLGLSLSSVPMEGFKSLSTSWYVLLVPFLVMIATFVKMYPSLKLASTVSEKFKVYGLCVLFVALLGWLSLKLPIAISLYWIVNDITYLVFDYYIHKYLPKNKFVADTLKKHKEKLWIAAQDKERAEEEQKRREEAKNAVEPIVSANEAK